MHARTCSWATWELWWWTTTRLSTMFRANFPVVFSFRTWVFLQAPSLNKHGKVSHTHTHTCTWSKCVTFAAQTVRKKIILTTELKVWLILQSDECEHVCVCVCTWAGDTAPPQHRDCWLSSSDASGTWQRADRSWWTHRQVRQAELVGGARIPGSDSSTMRTYMVAMAMSLSDRVSLAGFGTTGSSISNLDILDMVPFWKRWTPGQMIWCFPERGEGRAECQPWRRTAAGRFPGRWWTAGGRQSLGCTGTSWC